MTKTQGMQSKVSKILLFVTLLALLLGAMYRYALTNFHTVLEQQVFRSAQLSPQTLTDKVKEHNIATVVNLRGPSPESNWHKAEKRVSAKLGVKHIDVKLSSAGLNRVNRIKELIDIYKTQPRPILFHCYSGADRAGLASTLVLLLDGKLSLDEIEKHTSWRYFAFNSDSTGKLFFSAYQRWLSELNIEHTPAALIDWVDNYYLDDNGNRYYRISKIGNEKVPKKKQKLKAIMLSRKKHPIVEFSGSIMHYRGRAKPTKVEVLLGQKTVSKMLDSTFHLRSKIHYDYHGFTKVSWHAQHNAEALKNGCYNVQLKLTRSKEVSWISPPRAQLCITP